MVAKIKSGKSLIGALNYNENKVKAGKAILISVNGYLKNPEALTFDEKLFRLKDLAERNCRTKTNTVHLSLNFDLTEKFGTEELTNIADEYMKRIGFKYQPYLVYRHVDAGHPHIHIVSTNIEQDGKRISLHNIGELKSEPARKGIEIDFGLVQASSKSKQLETGRLKIQPLEYGQTDTKRMLSIIVNEITKCYKFTSLAELNAVLNLFNINADRGSKESVMFIKGGLHYWVIDSNGKKLGVPIKASSIYTKPTLKLLEDRFKLNEYLRKPYKEKLKSKIDSAISQATSLSHFEMLLRAENVSLVIRQNTEGRIYGLSYVDLSEKVVFNGSDLGKNYSAASIMNTAQLKSAGKFNMILEMPVKNIDHTNRNIHEQFVRTGPISLLEELLHPVDPSGSIPTEFGRRKKKKKRRNLNL